jgi:hypothetical protein
MKQAKTIEKTRTMYKCSHRDAVDYVQTKQVTNQAPLPSHSTSMCNIPDSSFLNYLLHLPELGISVKEIIPTYHVQCKLKELNALSAPKLLYLLGKLMKLKFLLPS